MDNLQENTMIGLKNSKNTVFLTLSPFYLKKKKWHRQSLREVSCGLRRKHVCE
jgi:hypothetical protein